MIRQYNVQKVCKTMTVMYVIVCCNNPLPLLGSARMYFPFVPLINLQISTWLPAYFQLYPIPSPLYPVILQLIVFSKSRIDINFDAVSYLAKAINLPPYWFSSLRKREDPWLEVLFDSSSFIYVMPVVPLLFFKIPSWVCCSFGFFMLSLYLWLCTKWDTRFRSLFGYILWKTDLSRLLIKLIKTISN